MDFEVFREKGKELEQWINIPFAEGSHTECTGVHHSAKSRLKQ